MITTAPRTLDALRAKLAGKAHFIGVGIGDGPDTQTLDALAGATGGYATTIDLADDLGWRAFDLVAALHTARVTGLEARLVDASGAAVPATAYLRSAAARRRRGDRARRQARGRRHAGRARADRLARRRAVDEAHRAAGAAHDGGYLPRMWAQRHIAARLLAKHEPAPPCAGEPCGDARPSAARRATSRSAARSSRSARSTSCCRATPRCSCSRTTRCTRSTA